MTKVFCPGCKQRDEGRLIWCEGHETGTAAPGAQDPAAFSALLSTYDLARGWDAERDGLPIPDEAAAREAVLSSHRRLAAALESARAECNRNADTIAELEAERDRLAEAESVAAAFHEAYERLAPAFGYATRPESAKPWSEVPPQNRALMCAVVAEVVMPKLSEGKIRKGGQNLIYQIMERPPDPPPMRVSPSPRPPAADNMARVHRLTDALEEIASGRGCQSGYGGCACKEIAHKALKDAPPGPSEWAEGYRQGFAAGMAYASEIAYEIPEPAVASEPIPIATATPVIDTATGLAIPVCTCVRGPSSVVPSQSCPVHGWTPGERHA